MLIIFLRAFKFIFPYFFLPNNECRSDLCSSPSALGICRALLMRGWAAMSMPSPLRPGRQSTAAPSTNPPWKPRPPSGHHLRPSTFAQRSTSDITFEIRDYKGESGCSLGANSMTVSLSYTSTPSYLIRFSMPTAPPPNVWHGMPTVYLGVPRRRQLSGQRRTWREDSMTTIHHDGDRPPPLLCL